MMDLRSEAIGRICRALGIDIHQYRLLLRLFSMLSDRLEFMGMTAGLKRVLGFYIFASLVMSLFVLGKPPMPFYLVMMIGYSMFMMFLILFMDAENSIMNPDEASVLAHQPIQGATYVAAKLSHLLTLVGAFIPSLNLIPAVAGLLLPGARWFYPLTHLLAAYLAGLFIAFLVCGIYGWLFRLVSPAKLKNAALWLQLIAFTAMMTSQSLLPAFLHERSPLRQFLKGLLQSSWMPWRWFVAIGLAGQAEYANFSVWEAVAACFLTCAFIAFGLRAFRADYMASVSTLIQGGAGSASRSTQRRSRLSSLVRRMAGAPSGYGAFAFTCIMTRRDWAFRRQALLVFMYAPMMLAALIKGIPNSPFVQGDFSFRSFSPVHFLPSFLGWSLALTCSLIPFTAEPKGSGMFVPLPFGNLGSFVRGIYVSLWLPLAFLHVFLLPFCVRYWGAPRAVLFILFSLALSTCYLDIAVFLIEGFPFAAAVKPARAKDLQMLVVLGMIPIVLITGIQWIVFHYTFLVVSAAVILAALAYALARLSLGKFESRVRVNLKMLGFTPSHMFEEIEK